MISINFQGKQLNITVTQVYAPTTDAEEVDLLHEDLQHLLEHQKRYLIYHRGLECKVGSQDIPRITGKYGLGVQNEAEQRLTELCQENMLVIANTLFQQYKR